jgi:tetratricopeptide (TPR) repeat protein
MRRAAMWTLGVMISTASSLPAQRPQTTGWQADVDSLVARILRIHPRPWAHIPRDTFLQQAVALRAAAATESDGAVLAGMMRLAASLEDGHTSITDLGPAGAKWYPVRFYLFSDGLWITAVTAEHAELAGARVLRLGSISADTAVARVLPLFSADNAWGRREGAALLSNAVLLEALGIAASEDSLPVETTRGRATLGAVANGNGDASWWQYGEISGPPGTHLVTAFGKRDAEGYRDPGNNADLPLHLRGRRAYWWTYLPQDSTVYFAFNNVVARSRYSQLTLMEELRQALDRVDSAPAATKRFILDMRYNSGGDGSLTAAIVNEFVKRDASIGQRGRFFVITGRKTFSAAAGTVIDLLRHASPLLVGEPMGVGFNASGDPGHSVLPDGHIQVAISTNSTTVTALDNVRVIPVQIPAATSGEDYFAGRDPPIAAILAAPAPYPEVLTTLRDQGAEAAQALWTTQARRYGRFDWWLPFTWEGLNDLSYRLLDLKRLDDAVAGFQLNTQSFPGRWEAWDSLGDGYRAAGRAADAAAAYRRALELAPDNWNASHQRQAIQELTGKTPR